ncbi:CU044_2847 family protein [Streptomyces sp. NPDC058773]|uniref:CU044_2847 family protein n=1 Tax=Streptomyces sp. NPDC058773 TaxID=3346632 RepID=UPI0036AB19C6
MPQLTEFSLADGTSVCLELAPTTAAAPPAQSQDADLPDGMGPTVPVARGGAAAGAGALAAMRTTLQPLGPLLQEIHDAVIASQRPPHEMSVQFGVQVGQDLKLGIVGANGHASLTITATWQPQRAD